MTAAQEKLATLEAEKAALQQQVDTISKQLSEARDLSKKEKAALQEQINKLKAEIEQKTKEIEALKQGMQSHQGQEKPKDPKTPEAPKEPKMPEAPMKPEDPKTPEKKDQPQTPVPWTALTPAKPIDTTKAPKSSAPSSQTGAATPKKQLPATSDTATPSFFTAAAMAVLASVGVLTRSPRRKKD